MEPLEPEVSPPLEDRLDSWKEIAAYLGRGVRTAQRWERLEGLPIRRHQHDKRGTVFALRSEIDAWRQAREATGALDAGDPTEEPPAAPPARKIPLALAAAAVLAVLALLALGYVFYRPAQQDRSSSLRPFSSGAGHALVRLSP